MFDRFLTINNFITALRSVPPWQVALELLVIGGVVYWVIRFLHGTRGARLLKGLGFVLITLYLGVRLLGAVLDLSRLEVLFNQFLFYASFAIIVVFQPELRRALMRLGETRLFRGIGQQSVDEIEQLVDACATLSRRRIGALIALERDVGLGGVAEDATRIDAVVSSPLLQTIFYPNTALHDLGLIISNGKIAYAGVQFPLAESGDLPKELGSRHRAAVGLSQETDAVVVIVSEETGDISIAERGKLARKRSVDQLRNELYERMGQSVTVPMTVDAGEAKAKPKTPTRPAAAPRPATPKRESTNGQATAQTNGQADGEASRDGRPVGGATPTTSRRETTISPDAEVA